MTDTSVAGDCEMPLIVTHTGCVWGSQVTLGVKALAAAQMLGPDIVHVHRNALDEQEWLALAQSNGKVSISVETELNMGMGRPVFAQCRRHGVKPTLFGRRRVAQQR